MHQMKLGMVAVGAIVMALASPAVAENKQYAVKQKKTFTKVLFNKQVRITNEAEAKIFQRNGTTEFALISDKPDVRAAWVTEISPPIQARHIEFTCRLGERGVIFKKTVDPIVRVEYSSVNDSTHRFLTLPVGSGSLIFSGDLSQVDGANPIIHRVAVVALQKQGIAIDDHADMLVYDLKVGIVYTKGTVDLNVREDDGSDKFINDANH